MIRHGTGACPHTVDRAAELARRIRVALCAAIFVVTLLVVGTVGVVFGRTADADAAFGDPAEHPHAWVYDRLAQVELGVTPEFLAEQLGAPRRSVDLCEEIPCPPEAAGRTLTMNLYRLRSVEVRALFDGTSLEWFAITLLSDDLHPPVRWIDLELGELGTFTFADAMEAAGTDPTDIDLFLGPRSAAYVEVVSVGAPGDYHGLILACAPGGGAGHFDREAADAVDAIGGEPLDPAVAEPFRVTSMPDTFGEYVDDGGVVSRMASDAGFTRVLLYLFTTP
ncbi:MAG TPA: ETEC_3214 domain-containing protein [Pseudonocardia sp.]|jgi:hypothetical protein|uniref:ETEC_3214 domain-containing protein n=1 Tax=Pseudonocardia sp. TaxID=60912 RepID=UPI002B4B1887|nr:ETEC_3214 domain-containing protein [Pseudonocardia sp.]HLU55878.1 ETEC_3214 domain-containing protein [Pseudonocardia sp.]